MGYEQEQSRSIQEGSALAQTAAVVGSQVAAVAVRQPWKVCVRHCKRRRSHGKRNPFLVEEARNKDPNDAGGASREALGRVWRRQPNVEQAGGTQSKLERRSYGGETGVVRERGMASCVRLGLEERQSKMPPMPFASRGFAGHADAHSPHQAVCCCGVAGGNPQPRPSLRSLPPVRPFKKECAS
jgi:hypothetical protein